MNRRQMLAGGAALPAAALPIPALAVTANGTDVAWQALVAAEAEHKARDAALDAAEAAWSPGDWTDPTAELPAINGKAPRPVTLAELRKARDADPLLIRMSHDMAATMRDMLAREAEYRPLRTPEAVADRRALYERLEADLTAREAAAQPVKPAHVVRAEADLIAAEKRAGVAEAALFTAPVLTIEDAARKLHHAIDSHMDPGDYSTELVASALAGLRRLAGIA